MHPGGKEGVGKAGVDGCLGLNVRFNGRVSRMGGCDADGAYNTSLREKQVQNVEQVLERGEKLELLVDKTEGLQHQVRTT